MQAEDADVLIMLVRRSSSINNPLFLTTSKGSYNVRGIREALSERQKCYLLFSHVFTGCDTVSAIGGHGKTNLFDWFSAGIMDEHIDSFLDLRATVPRMQSSGVVLQFSSTFTMHQMLLWVRFGTTCFHERRQLGLSSQKLYFQQREELHSILSMPICKHATGCCCRACLWTPVIMYGQYGFMVLSQPSLDSMGLLKSCSGLQQGRLQQ